MIEFGSEYVMDGGIYDQSGEDRTDVYLEICSLEPRSFQVSFVTGSSTYQLLEMSRADVKRLCDWLIELTKDG